MKQRPRPKDLVEADEAKASQSKTRYVQLKMTVEWEPGSQGTECTATRRIGLSMPEDTDPIQWLTDTVWGIYKQYPFGS